MGIASRCSSCCVKVSVLCRAVGLCLLRQFIRLQASCSSLLCELLSVLFRALVIYGVTFLLILPLLCRNLPHSKYFITPDDVHQQVLDQNQQRVTAAEKYLSTLQQDDIRLSKSLPDPGSLRIVIGVVSVSRQTKSFSTQYLTQIMARLHEGMTRHGVRDEVFMFICNAEKTGREHPEADQLASYFHVERFPPDRPRQEGWRHEEEKENHIFCLETAAKFKAKYVLLLQDDALPHSNFYEVLDYLLKSRLEATPSMGQSVHGTDDWAWLKLSFPDSLAVIHRNTFFASEWISFALTGAGVISLIYYIYTGKASMAVSDDPATSEQKSQRRCATATNAVFVLSFVYFLLAYWLIGRPYVLQLYGLSKYFTRLEPGTSCCLPAVLFPQKQIPGLVEYLKGVRCKPGFPLDFALDTYRMEAKLRQYLAVPNLFSHIGYYSALHGGPSRIAAYSYLYL